MKKAIMIVSILSLFVVSCKKDFEEINTNPNAPTTVNPDLLLRQVIYNYGEEMSYEGFVAGNLLGQHFSMVDFNLFDRHNLSQPQLGGNPWPIIYTNLRDNEILLEQATSNPIKEVYIGPALILKAYMTAALTDIYGDVPYSEAFNGVNGNVTPGYDKQEDIYTAENGILDNLTKGIVAIQSYTGTVSLGGDILFGGDLEAWVTFARSLQIKYLIRISSKRDVQAELQAIFDEGIFMLTNADNATFDFTSTLPNSFRMQQLREGDFKLFVMSETAEDILQNLNDPRIAVLYRQREVDGLAYAGLLNGPDASATSISVADYSLPGAIFRENTGDLDANFMTAAETLFLLAEAAEKGLIATSAQSLYESAVEQSFMYWNTEMPASYLLTGPAAYGSNGADKIEQIITQKWIMNTINGYEGWIEWRRTGFPVLKPISASLNEGLIPVRMPYPTDEASLNQASYKAATAANGNSVNAKVWWDND